MLRRIAGRSAADNVAHVVGHVGLNQDELWGYFKNETAEARILQELEALEAEAQHSAGMSFAALPASKQDALLCQIETGDVGLAWPIDPESKTVRNGSRLNKVLLLRLDPEGFDPETKERAADGVVGYSAICPHTGCDVTNWHPDRRLLECPCHYSIYDPKEAAKVLSGPAPRRLPALPLKIADGKLAVAKPFIGRPGFQQM